MNSRWRNLIGSLVFVVAFFKTSYGFFSVGLTGQTDTSISVYIINVETSTTYINVSPRHDPSNLVRLETNVNQGFKITDLKSNLLYRIASKSSTNGTEQILYARTAPKQPSFTYIARPTFVILLIGRTPGATKWKVGYSEANNKATLVANVPHNVTTSHYAVVLRDLRPNFRYTCYVYVTELYNALNITLSGTPVLGNFVTAPLSLFGRVLYTAEPFQSSSFNQSWKQGLQEKLKVAYNKVKQNGVNQVLVLEAANSTSGFPLVHHEVVLSVDDKSPVNASSYALSDGNQLKDSKLFMNAASDAAFSYVNNSLAWVLKPSNGCPSRDTRIWTILDDVQGVRHNLTLPMTNASSTYGNIDLHFNGRDILSSNRSIWRLTENSVIAVGHEYLVKTCPPGMSNTAFYDRVYKATAGETTIRNQYGIIYTTGPGPLPNDNVTVDIRPLQHSSSNLRVEISIPPTPRATGYHLQIISQDGNFRENLTLSESEIDNSTRFRFNTTNILTRGQLYNVTMRVTTRLANGTSATSPESSLQFYAGAPKNTSIRIIEIYPDRFTVAWQLSQYARGHEVNLRSGATNRNVTINGGQTEFKFNQTTPGQIYEASVAGFNHFGTGPFSDLKKNKIWAFEIVKATEIQVTWREDASDEWYVVTTNLTSVEPTVTRGTTVTLKGLAPATVHQIKVTFNTSDARERVLFVTNQLTVPSAPTNLRATFANATSFTLAWDDVNGSVSYSADVTNAGVTRKFTTKASSLVVGGKAGTTYLVQVFAHNSAGMSVSSPLNVSTATLTPVILGTFDITNSSFRVEWRPTLHAISYLVYVTDDVSVTSQFESSDANRTVTGLAPGTHYVIEVAAKHSVGFSNRSKSFSQITIPAIPQNLSAAVLSSNQTISVKWSNTKGAKGYLLTYSVENTNTSVTVQASSYLVRNITFDATYSIAVKSQNEAGSSENAHTSAFTGLPPPSDVSINDITNTSFTVGWNQIHGAVYYQISVYYNGTATLINTTAHAGNVIISLRPGTGYNISAAAEYATGRSPWSNLILQYTAAPNPETIWYTGVTNASITSQWTAPEYEGTVKYRLRWFSLSGANRLRGNASLVIGERHQVSGLLSGTRYQIEVTSVSFFNNVGQKSYQSNEGSPSFVLTTVPNPPTNLSTSDITNGHVTLYWNASRGAVSYVVTIRSFGDSQGSTRAANYTSNTTELVVSDLPSSSTSHTISLSSINAEGRQSPFTDPTTIKPRSAQMACCGPLPWWSVLAVSCIMFLLLVMLVVWKVRQPKHKRLRSTGDEPDIENALHSSDLEEDTEDGSEKEPVYANVNKKKNDNANPAPDESEVRAENHEEDHILQSPLTEDSEVSLGSQDEPSSSRQASDGIPVNLVIPDPVVKRVDHGEDTSRSHPETSLEFSVLSVATTLDEDEDAEKKTSSINGGLGEDVKDDKKSVKRSRELLIPDPVSSTIGFGKDKSHSHPGSSLEFSVLSVATTLDIHEDSDLTTSSVNELLSEEVQDEKCPGSVQLSRGLMIPNPVISTIRSSEDKSHSHPETSFEFSVLSVATTLDPHEDSSSANEDLTQKIPPEIKELEVDKSSSEEVNPERDLKDVPSSSSSSGGILDQEPRNVRLEQETTEILGELDKIFAEDLEEEEGAEAEFVRWKERFKFSLKGKPGKLTIVDRTAKEDEEVL